MKLNRSVFESLARIGGDLSGGCSHVLAGLGDGSSGGHFSVQTCRIFNGLLPAPGGGIPASGGDSALTSPIQLSKQRFTQVLY